MTSTEGPERTEETMDLTDWVACLGPATMRIDPDGIAGSAEPYVAIELDAADPARASVAQSWIDGPLEVFDAILGARSTNDPLRWLHLRGHLITTSGEIAALAIVSVPYEVGVEDIDIQIIADRIEGQHVRGILAALAAREN